jgi:hypothetical protein
VNKSKIDALIQAYEQEVLEDEIGLWQLVAEAQRLKLKGRDLREFVLEVVKEMLARGFRPGMHAKGGTVAFVPWPERNPQAIIRRIEAEWDALGRDPSIADIAWFDRPGDTRTGGTQ